MPIHASFLADTLTVVITIAIMWVPGGLAVAALGLRGWQLAASAPLVTYFVAGMAVLIFVSALVIAMNIKD